MAISLEEIIQRRYGGLSLQSAIEEEDQRESDALDGLVASNQRERDEEAKVAASVPYNTPAERLQGGPVYEPPVQDTVPTPEAQRRVIGVGETALQLGTGLVGGAVGLSNFLEGTIRKFGRTLPTREYMENLFNDTLPAEDPRYWEKLKEQSHKIASDFTYAPRSAEGRALSETINYPLQAFSYMSKRAAQAPLARMLLTEDQRHALEYAHEIVTMGLAGEIGMGVIGRARARRFQQEFQKSAGETLGVPERRTFPEPSLPESPPPETPSTKPLPTKELLDIASEIIAAAEASPEAINKLELAQGINPRLLPSLRERGRAVLKALEENPDNVEYQTNAVQFFETTRGVNDPIVRSLREEVGTTVPVGEITTMPRAERVQRLRDLQHNEKLGDLDRWMLTREELLSSPSRPEGIESVRPLTDSTGREAPSVPLSSIDTPALRQTRRQRDLSKSMKEEITEKERVAFTEGLEETRRVGKKIEYENLTAEEISSAEAYARGEPGGKPVTLREKASGIPTEDLKIEQAQAHARMFTSKPELLEKIHKSLETGISIVDDIRREVPGAVSSDIAAMRYEKLFDLARRGIKASEDRRVVDILSDIVELFAFDVSPTNLGSNLANISLSNRQRMAAQRLLADAKREKTDIGEVINARVDNQPDLAMAYRNYLASIDDAVVPPQAMPKNMRLDAQASTNPPVKRRVRDNGMDAPPVYADEVSAVQNAPHSSAVGPEFLEVPARAAKRFGEDIQNITVRPYRQIRTSIHDEVSQMRKDLTALKELASYNERKNISNYVLGKNNHLSPNELRAMEALEIIGGALIDRVNAVRQALGYEEIPPMMDTLPFMRTIVALKDEGNFTNLVKAPLDEIVTKATQERGRAFPQTLTQRMLRMGGEKDIYRIFDEFATGAIENIRQTPFTEKLRELINYGLPNAESPILPGQLELLPGTSALKNDWYMQRENPSLYRFMDGWTSFIEGRQNFEVGSIFGVDVDLMLRKLNNNLAFSVLSTSLSSIAAQPFALVQTIYRTGPANTAKAAGMVMKSALLRKGARQEALAESHVLSARNFSQVYGDMAESMSKGHLGEAITNFREGRVRDFSRDIAETGLWPLEVLDMESAIITYQAAKLQGQALGLRGKELINFADDAVIETQGSGWRGDLSPIQRNALGKAVTQFQTFTINDFNTILNDVLKINKGASTKEVLMSLGQFVGTVLAFNTVADLFHINSPLPQPFTEARKTYEATQSVGRSGLSAALELMTPLPIVGSTRYGKGIGGVGAAKLFVDFPESVRGGVMSKPFLQPVTEIAGIPGMSTFWRARKKDDVRPVYDRLTNYTGPSSDSLLAPFIEKTPVRRRRDSKNPPSPKGPRR